ncbi:hypothetical protein KKD19_06720 [Patescibacteria group bacterium]|nr:hypothetical protein [Patescibacteria group bacterium]MBU4512896.1 hypothetical protein [Patescibacteria group bacterium]MCG2692614.1 hypothetical protein [Candidatus Parcubacteria bacterium]
MKRTICLLVILTVIFPSYILRAAPLPSALKNLAVEMVGFQNFTVMEADYQEITVKQEELSPEHTIFRNPLLLSWKSIDKGKRYCFRSLVLKGTNEGNFSQQESVIKQALVISLLLLPVDVSQHDASKNIRKFLMHSGLWRDLFIAVNGNFYYYQPTVRNYLSQIDEGIALIIKKNRPVGPGGTWGGWLISWEPDGKKQQDENETWVSLEKTNIKVLGISILNTGEVLCCEGEKWFFVPKGTTKTHPMSWHK